MKEILFHIAAVCSALALNACAGKGPGSTTPPTVMTTPASTASPAAVTPPPANPSPAPAVSSFKETAKADPATVTPYPFTTCAVIRKDLEGSPKYRRVYKNQEVLFCCTPCLKTFDANPEPYMPRIVEAAAAKARGETVNSGW